MNMVFRKLGMLLLLLSMSSVPRVQAFTLAGPYASWQTTAIGYQLTVDEIAGPMNISEEYRVNMPVLNYAFDSTFLHYFGSKGETAINEAMGIMNAIPSADSLDLNDFPLQAKGPINFTALNLNLIDMKSLTLGTMLAQFGIGAPERYVWCLRDRATLPNNAGTNYLVIQRNFDPFQARIPTNVVNGTIYTYTIFDPVAVFLTAGTTIGAYADAVERPVDPVATDFTTLAGIENSDPARGGNLGFGEYFTGMTREDAAAWKYLYSGNNFNIEDPPTGVALSTNSFIAGSPFQVAGASNTFVTNVLVTTALRPGVGSIELDRVVFDSLVGTVLNVTNDYIDSFITNGIFDQQVLTRIQTTPDILFRSEDLGTIGFASPVEILRTDSAGWTDNSSINSANGSLGTGTGGGLAGPGVIEPAIEIVFNRVGPHRINQDPFFLDENTVAIQGFAYAHFDTANIFALFPNGSDVEEIEARIRGGETTTQPNESPFGQ
jgi:hypothetical protein